MLPQPPPNLARHSALLAARISEKIEERGGWISFEEYMHCALYSQDMGYYVSGLAKFGEEGDFITAPMLGDLFAKSIAVQCEEVFALTGCNRKIIEFGAGNGRLAADMMMALETEGVGLQSYWIVETSPELQARQRQTIASSDESLLDRVQWLTTLPDQFDGVIVANELLDAIAVTRFEMDAMGMAMEVGVKIVEDQNGEYIHQWQRSDKPLNDRLQARLESFGLSAGYRSEVGVQAEAWIRSVTERLQQGAMLLIDYGFAESEYYHPDRRDGTLMCHYRHRAHADPFFYPGLQDITAHIDFSAMARAAEEVGGYVAGYSSQGGFLLSLGMLDLFELGHDDEHRDVRDRILAAQQIKKLTLPHEMGELFKVLALTKDDIGPLKGFSIQNHKSRL